MLDYTCLWLKDLLVGFSILLGDSFLLSGCSWLSICRVGLLARGVDLVLGRVHRFGCHITDLFQSCLLGVLGGGKRGVRDWCLHLLV